jgi:hypothetical protein
MLKTFMIYLDIFMKWSCGIDWIVSSRVDNYSMCGTAVDCVLSNPRSDVQNDILKMLVRANEERCSSFFTSDRGKQSIRQLMHSMLELLRAFLRRWPAAL